MKGIFEKTSVPRAQRTNKVSMENFKINQLKNGRELGTLIIFPSFLWHQVTPVTEGTRQSLVNWSIGKPFI